METKVQQFVVFTTGKSLNVGDTFYYVNPEMHDGSIEKMTVDSFWPAEYFYGERIRCTSDKNARWNFVYRQFFERENPTCFLDFEEAKRQADSQIYSYLTDRVQ